MSMVDGIWKFVTKVICNNILFNHSTKQNGRLIAYFIIFLRIIVLTASGFVSTSNKSQRGLANLNGFIMDH